MTDSIATTMTMVGIITWLVTMWFVTKPPTDTPEPGDVYHWNDASRLAPVGCPLLLNLGPDYDWDIAQGERIDHLESRDRQMTYRLSTGRVVTGRFDWTYP